MQIIKTWLSTPLLILFLFGMLPSAAVAAGSATMQLSPTAKTVTVGANVTLQISINPNGEAIDTARANLNYPANLLQATNFGLNGALGSISPGNYLNSNGAASLGGFTVDAPMTTSGNFGVITFKALAPGVATVRLLPSSRLITEGVEKINTAGLNSAVITIVAATPVPGQTTSQITSTTHPNQEEWYNTTEAKFRWTLDGSEYFWAYDQNPDTDPSTPINATELTIPGIKQGVYYFHLKNSAGELLHYQTKTDQTPPRPFEPFLEVEPDNKLTLRFGTDDEFSGISHYELQINNGEYRAVTSPFVLQGLSQGENTLTLRAFDNAANFQEGWIKFVITEDGSVREIQKSGVCPTSKFSWWPNFCCQFPLICKIWWILLILLAVYVLTRLRKHRS